jgi:hypothetical protein
VVLFKRYVGRHVPTDTEWLSSLPQRNVKVAEPPQALPGGRPIARIQFRKVKQRPLTVGVGRAYEIQR